jgi:hemoglobin-like flavoprotein
MTPQQIQLVRHSHATLQPMASEVAERFYRSLFAADPAIAALFGGDMVRQGERLMQMIGAAVGLLDRPAQLMPVLAQLGARHAGYGVLPAHYDTVGGALLQTLADCLGPDFDDATRQAWATMYGLVSVTMQQAAGVPAACADLAA